jgi:hypothetical protein
MAGGVKVAPAKQSGISGHYNVTAGHFGSSLAVAAFGEPTMNVDNGMG